MWRYSLPLLLFAGLVLLLISGLQNDPRRVPSPHIDQPAPDFSLSTLQDGNKIITQDMLKGQVSLLNVWASWCVACRIEHPLLVAAAQKEQLNIYGLNYKDTRPAAIQWLNELGNPYRESAYDDTGKVGIDYGVYGVPETFIIDKQGIIRYKHIGPIEQDDLQNTLLPLVKKLDASS